MGQKVIYTWLSDRTGTLIKDKYYRCESAITDGYGRCTFTIRVMDKNGHRLKDITRKGKMDPHGIVPIQIDGEKFLVGAECGNIYNK